MHIYALCYKHSEIIPVAQEFRIYEDIFIKSENHEYLRNHLETKKNHEYLRNYFKSLKTVLIQNIYVKSIFMQKNIEKELRGFDVFSRRNLLNQRNNFSANSIDFSAERLCSEKLRFHTLHVPEMHI